MIVVCSSCGTPMRTCAACLAACAYPYECPRGCVQRLPVTQELAQLCDVHRPPRVRVPVVARDWDDAQKKQRRARRLLTPHTRPRRTYARAA